MAFGVRLAWIFIFTFSTQGVFHVVPDYLGLDFDCNRALDSFQSHNGSICVFFFFFFFFFLLNV